MKFSLIISRLLILFLFCPVLRLITQKDFPNNWKKYKKELLTTLNSSTGTIRQLALQCLETNIQSIEKHPITKKSLVATAGKMNMGVALIKEKLGNLNVQFIGRITPEVTHIIVGEKPNKKLKTLLNSEATLIVERELETFLEGKKQFYLRTEKEEGLSANLKALLVSKELMNIELAFSMMKTGGVPKELIHDLFILYQFSKEATIKKEAKTLLKRYASPTLQSRLTKHFSLNVYGEKTFIERVIKLCKDTELKSLEVIYSAFLEDGHCKFFLLQQGTSLMKKSVLEFLHERYKPRKQMMAIPHQITRVPKELFEITSIERLTFANLKLTEIPNTFDQLKNLKILDLSFLDLTEIPSSIGQLKQLEVLVLSNNKLTKIPHFLANIKSLKSIYINNNPIVTLPTNFAQLQALKVLDLSYTGLPTLPLVLCQLSNLNDLIIGGKQLSIIPSTIHQLKDSLEELIIKPSSIQKLPKELFQLHKLQVLDIQRSKITSFDVPKDTLKNLIKLNLSYNAFEHFPTTILQLPKLERLFLNFCKIPTLPDTITQLQNLKTIEVRNNNIEVVCRALFFMPCLRNIHLSDNKLSTFPDIEHTQVDMILCHNNYLSEETTNRIKQLPSHNYQWNFRMQKKK